MKDRERVPETEPESVLVFVDVGEEIPVSEVKQISMIHIDPGMGGQESVCYAKSRDSDPLTGYTPHAWLFECARSRGHAKNESEVSGGAVVAFGETKYRISARSVHFSGRVDGELIDRMVEHIRGEN